MPIKVPYTFEVSFDDGRDRTYKAEAILEPRHVDPTMVQDAFAYAGIYSTNRADMKIKSVGGTLYKQLMHDEWSGNDFNSVPLINDHVKMSEIIVSKYFASKVKETRNTSDVKLTKLPKHGNFETDQKRVLDRIEAFAAHLAVIDGEIYETTPEPCYVVEQNGLMWISETDWIKTEYDITTQRVFLANEFAEARRLAKSIRTDDRKNPELLDDIKDAPITVYADDFVTFDINTQDVTRCLRRIIDITSHYLTVMPISEIKQFYDLKSPIPEGSYELADYITAFNATSRNINLVEKYASPNDAIAIKDILAVCDARYEKQQQDLAEFDAALTGA